MSFFNYLKITIRQHGYTLQHVAKANGMTKEYLSKLLNSKIKNPNIYQLESLHRFLNLKFPYYKKNIGVIFGKFYPLHTGHIYLIQRAYGQVDELHVIMGYDEVRDFKLFKNSKMSQQPTFQDRLRWLLQTFKYQKNINILSFNEQGIEPYPTGWKSWGVIVMDFLKQRGIQPGCFFTSEKLDAPKYQQYLGHPAIIVDSNRFFMNISASKIRQDPLRYWDYIPTEVKPFFVRKVAILGDKYSGKSILVHKLSNIFNTTSTGEYRQNYIVSQLGGDKMALQYSDYYKIALGQAQCIDTALKYANKVVFIDTDFITIQAYCLQHEGRKHPLIQALINEYLFDLVILLKNNVYKQKSNFYKSKYSKRNDNFQFILSTILFENNIKFIHLIEDDYDKCFLRCIKLVKKVLV